MDFPEPERPTTASVLAGRQREVDAPQHLDRAAVGRPEALAEADGAEPEPSGLYGATADRLGRRHAEDAGGGVGRRRSAPSAAANSDREAEQAGPRRGRAAGRRAPPGRPRASRRRAARRGAQDPPPRGSRRGSPAAPRRGAAGRWRPSACLMPNSRIRSKVDAATVLERESPPITRPIPPTPGQEPGEEGRRGRELPGDLAGRHHVHPATSRRIRVGERVGSTPSRPADGGAGVEVVRPGAARLEQGPERSGRRPATAPGRPRGPRSAKRSGAVSSRSRTPTTSKRRPPTGSPSPRRSRRAAASSAPTTVPAAVVRPEEPPARDRKRRVVRGWASGRRGRVPAPVPG